MKMRCFLLLSAVLFALAACTTPGGNGGGNNGDNPGNDSPKSKYDIVIDNLMSECKDFDAQTLVQGLPGEWREDSILSYDDEWTTITSPWCVMGDMNCAGLSLGDYTFTADGKGSCRITLEFPPEDIVSSFEWQYDAESSTLILNYENHSVQRKVSGFNGEYLVLDYYDTTNEDNKREILKAIRVIEDD
jgi:hypothetical protein